MEWAIALLLRVHSMGMVHQDVPHDARGQTQDLNPVAVEWFALVRQA
jgi:hypothetical protein